jgi:vacuolar-type H+-ATPase subunit H
MSSKDLLEGLFDVEREAEELVEAARAEARKRVEAAKSSSRALVEEARAKALAAAQEEEEAARVRIDSEYRRSLEAFKTALAESMLDHESFAKVCGEAIVELFPR